MGLPFKGSVNGTATSEAYNLPFKITFFTVANKNAGVTTLNVTVTDGITDLSIVPQNLLLNQGDMLEGSSEQIIEIGSQIKVASDALVDYFFTIENIEPT